MHLVVIGNGIVALSTAYRCARSARAGDRITIVGPADRVGSASLAAAAMLSAYAELELGSLADELGRLHLELARSAQQLWPAFAEDLAGPDGIARLGYGVGTYVVDSEGGGAGAENLDAIVAALVEHDEPHRIVRPRDIPGFDPSREARGRAVFIDREGWINPRLVIAYLERALATFPNVGLVPAHVDRLCCERGVITAVKLDDGRTIEGTDFLLAAGAAVTGILERSALDLAVQRVFYGIGVSLEVRSPELAIHHCIRAAARELAVGLYALPYHPGHVLLGASSWVSPEPATTVAPDVIDSLVQTAAMHIHRAFPRAEIVRANVGWRPTSEDTYPVLGRTSVDNLVIASGTRRDGFHLAPLLSEHLSALLRREPVDARLGVFAPERAPIRSFTREQAIARAVRYKLHREQVERVHDRAGAHDWGIPPEMLEIY